MGRKMFFKKKRKKVKKTEQWIKCRYCDVEHVRGNWHPCRGRQQTSQEVFEKYGKKVK